VRTLARVSEALERLLEVVLMLLMVTLTLVVVVAVVYRKAGASLSWYDEVASIMLAWLTYYGAALAALKRAHIGFDGLVRAFAPGWRMAAVAVSEIFVFGFFVVLAWTGWIVLLVLEGDTLVSLPEVSVQITQSVIPIGAVLFIVCEAVSLPGYWRRMRDNLPDDHGAPAAADPDERGAAR
jgi:TRAP-type C4-dicarboxylate transport system permease small subunit